MIKEKLNEEINKYKELYLKNVKEDKWRPKYHLAAPIGWINDPNGLCYFKGQYHVYFQYSPLNPDGGLKFWGHYTSNDLVTWKEEPIALYPDNEFDKDGVYSGSALVKDDKIYFYYTGNVKSEGNHDYILSGREQNVIVVESDDGINFSDKKVVLTNENFPGNMSLHVRDPKVWEEDGIYYMVLGARSKDDRGYVLRYKSLDLYKWELYSEPIGGEKEMGYMWECPDFFRLNGEDIFMFSPQGIESQGNNYNNIYQSGYTVGNINAEKKITLNIFTEIDRGFDFYAPHTFSDDKGRRIMIGWMGVPDDIEHINPTVENFWQHQLTIPRELALRGDKLYQVPVKELESLRNNYFIKKDFCVEDEAVLELFDGNTYEINIQCSNCSSLEIVFRKECRLEFKESVFSLALGKCGYGRSVRNVEIESIEQLRIFSDNSSLEIFLNGGREVFSTRVYNDEIDRDFRIKGNGKITIEKWDL